MYIARISMYIDIYTRSYVYVCIDIHREKCTSGTFVYTVFLDNYQKPTLGALGFCTFCVFPFFLFSAFQMSKNSGKTKKNKKNNPVRRILGKSM